LTGSSEYVILPERSERRDPLRGSGDSLVVPANFFVLETVSRHFGGCGNTARFVRHFPTLETSHQAFSTRFDLGFGKTYSCGSEKKVEKGA
jgi:hypothetical protein